MEQLLTSLTNAGLILGIIVLIGIVLRIAIKPVANLSKRQQLFEAMQAERDERYDKVISHMEVNNANFEKFTSDTQKVFEQVNQNLFKVVGGLELANLKMEILNEQTSKNTREIGCLKREFMGMANHVNFKTTINDENNSRVHKAV